MTAPGLTTAAFSAREAAKQLILLEDHLAVPEKRCADCIGKHRLAAEAFAEEALALDGAGSLPFLADLPGRIRAAQGGQDFRAVRKALTQNLTERGLLGLGANMTGVHVDLISPKMDPRSWAASDPARQLGLRFVGPAGGSWLFETDADAGTVDLLLSRDPRVAGHSAVPDSRGGAPVTVIRQPALVGERRPAPGSPGPLQLASYVPKTSGGALTWDEKLLAENPGIANRVFEPSGLPWWAVAGLAFLALS